jgi:hypothetical protein
MIILIFGTCWKTSGLAHVFWHSVARIALPRADANLYFFFIEFPGLEGLGLEEEYVGVVVMRHLAWLCENSALLCFMVVCLTCLLACALCLVLGSYNSHSIHASPLRTSKDKEDTQTHRLLPRLLVLPTVHQS